MNKEQEQENKNNLFYFLTTLNNSNYTKAVNFSLLEDRAELEIIKYTAGETKVIKSGIIYYYKYNLETFKTEFLIYFKTI